MKYALYALIRRRIRTLYPDPLLRVLMRMRGVQAGLLTVGLYAAVFALLSQIEVRPSRRTDLYTQDIAVTILPPAPETVESDTTPASLEAVEAAQPSRGEGVYTPNRGEGLEQVDSGDAQAPVPEEKDTKETAPSGDDKVTTEGSSKKEQKEDTTKVRLAGEEKNATEIAPKEQKAEQEPETETAVAVEEKEPEKEPTEHDAKSDGRPVRTEIMPAYVIDRAPSFAVLVPTEFPEDHRNTILDREVILHVYLTASGSVAHIEPIRSGGIEFDEAAIRTILASTFAPAQVGPRSVPCRVEISFRFTSSYAEEAG